MSLISNAMRFCVLFFALALSGGLAQAARHGAPAHGQEEGGGARVLRDIAYGELPRQRFDVYLPAQPRGPVLFMVHGGAWRSGSKSEAAVVENKVPHFTAQGYVVVVADYRLLPQAEPLEQVRDVARALAAAQGMAASWGADRKQFVLMGHSAGAHLATLLAARPALVSEAGCAPWLGTIALDSAAYDLVALMEQRHLRLYDQAFGKHPATWRSLSPYHALDGAHEVRPLLLVCSLLREQACPQAQALAGRARALGIIADVLEQKLSHRDLNLLLGKPGAYTAGVDAFIARLPGLQLRAEDGGAPGSR
ncbi:alpha/beta hydrolase [Massilia sp. BJB1822]|uniref:alpha/beta hydrolase n=1 Tax=Massilia sp. BJB1822 TaxID=2744470 RepID=UPI001593C761|nr:alpha/beta hydrolase [Massilia sp. BJB1822]NVE01868.1 alpha/beta hydrolase [Massilia sp. BJB1822]